MIQLLKISVLILLSLGLVATNESVIYYIKPIDTNHEDTCPAGINQTCLSLSEFGTVNRSNHMNILTVILLPGNHSLFTNISLSNFQTFKMYSEFFNATITCKLLAHFSFELIQTISIAKIDFIGCGSNLVKNVIELTFQESIFIGQVDTGTSLTLINSTAKIDHCFFIDNRFGTVMESIKALELITTNITWLIIRNVTGTVRVGGAVICTHSNVSIIHTTFENNTAEIGGDIYADEESKISILNSTFAGDGPQPPSEEPALGGAMFSHRSVLSIVTCQFHNKHASVGGSAFFSSSNIKVNGSNFDSNSATDHAGGLFAYNSAVFIYKSTFHNNTALGGAGVATYKGRITVVASIFTHNTAHQHGAALDFDGASSIIRGCHFEANIAHSFAGAVVIWFSTCTIIGRATLEETVQACNETCSFEYQDMNGSSEILLGDKTQFIANSAPAGAALYTIKSILKSCGPIYFSKNFATLNSNIYLLNSYASLKGLFISTQNVGSFFAFNSNVSFSGCTKFFSCSPPVNTTVDFKEGGALTLYQTMLSFHGEARFECNHAEIGGAMVAIESLIYLSDQVYVTVTNNSASISGGGLYFAQSELFSLRESTLTISSNSATEKGGGIAIISSLVTCTVTGSQHMDQNGNMIENYMGAVLNITENTAQKGGAIYLEANSKVTMLKDYVFKTDMKLNALNFIRNSAQYGGAIYIDDATNPGLCESNPFEVKSPKSECFIRVVSTQTVINTDGNFSLNNVYFDSNTATVSGATLFGGLLDRCIVSPFNEVDRTIN